MKVPTRLLGMCALERPGMPFAQRVSRATSWTSKLLIVLFSFATPSLMSVFSSLMVSTKEEEHS